MSERADRMVGESRDSFATGIFWSGASVVSAAMATGPAGYDVSLVLFVIAIRHLGTARAGAYFFRSVIIDILSSKRRLRSLSKSLAASVAALAPLAWSALCMTVSSNADDT
jgi:hypothetical protein